MDHAEVLFVGGRVRVGKTTVSGRHRRAPAGTLRVVTDGRTVIGTAAEVTAATGWVPARIS